MKALKICCFSTLVFGLSACTTWQKAGRILDRQAAYVAEYGTVYMSQPMMAEPKAVNMSFDLGDLGGAKSHFSYARDNIQGSVANFEQLAISLRAGTARQQDPTRALEYRENVQRYGEDLARYQRVRGLKDDAARDVYMARLEAASKMEDPEERQLKIAEAKQELAVSLDAPSRETLNFPTVDTTNNVPQKASGVAAIPNGIGRVLDQTTFGKASGLLTNANTPKMRTRDALITAAGDTAVETIFNILGRPEEVNKFSGKTVFFGASMVSVTPGWRTKKNFTAEINCLVESAYREAREEVVKAHFESKKDIWGKPIVEGLIKTYPEYRLSAPTYQNVQLQQTDALTKVVEKKAFDKDWKDGKKGYRAAVMAVSPMTDVMNLESRDSFRYRNELSLAFSDALQSAGLAQQAEVFGQYARQRENDLAVRYADVNTVAFSTSYLFGYQIGPSLRRLKKRFFGFAAPKPEYELSRQSFPVLILMGYDAEDFKIKVMKGANGQPRIYEPVSFLSSIPTWVPLAQNSKWRSPRISKILKDSRDGIEFKRLLGTIKTNDTSSSYTGVIQLANYHKDILGTKRFGSTSYQYFPLEFLVKKKETLKKGVFSGVNPQQIVLKKKADGSFENPTFEVVLYGENLTSLNLAGAAVQVETGGVGPNVTAVHFKGAIKVSLTPIDPLTSPVFLSFKPKSGTERLLSPPIHLKLHQEGQVRKAVKVDFESETTGSAKANRKIHGSVTFPGHATIEEVDSAVEVFEYQLAPSK